MFATIEHVKEMTVITEYLLGRSMPTEEKQKEEDLKYVAAIIRITTKSIFELFPKMLLLGISSLFCFAFPENKTVKDWHKTSFEELNQTMLCIKHIVLLFFGKSEQSQEYFTQTLNGQLWSSAKSQIRAATSTILYSAVGKSSKN